jgi:hypothetical protein
MLKAKKLAFAGGLRPCRLFLLGLGLSINTLCSPIAQADAVSDWSGVATTAAVVNAKRSPAPATFDLAYVHAAIYDSVNAIDGRYTPFAVKLVNVPLGASQEAATAAAAYTVLKTLYPTQQAFLDSAYTSALAGIPNGQAKDQGVDVGTTVATQFLALRANDGRDANVTYTFGSGAGVYQLTPGSPAPPIAPLAPWVAKAKPFALKSGDQFRPDGPPRLRSHKWAEDFNESKAYGALNNSLRTPEQTEIGLFYGIEHPVAQFNRIFRDFAATQGFSLADSARFFGQLYVTNADSLIAGWDAKYHFNFWRPVTAIRAGDTDGNDNTVADPGWVPLVVTPAHPEYPAAHGTFTGGYATFLRLFFGTKRVHITLTSTAVASPRSFDNTDNLIKEIIDARVFGGMHYRTSGEDGIKVGKKVAKWVARHYFLPVDRAHQDPEEDDE